MKIFLTLFVLLFSSSVVADDIKDYQIEGISIGDSLLDYMSENEILEEIKFNKPSYNYLTDEFGEIYLYKDFIAYDHLGFFVKTNDPEYIIYSIKGSIYFDNKITECYSKQKEISEEFSLLYNNAEKFEGTTIYPTSIDPSQKSNLRWVSFLFKSKDSISIDCKQYEKSLKIKNNWVDSMSIVIDTREVNIWFGNI